MASEKILTIVIATVVFFNLVFYVTGYNATLVNASTIISELVSVGVIAILISLIPTTSASGAVTYLLSGVVMLTILYSFNFSILTYNIQIGVGLVSNLSSMFPGDPSSLSFLPFLFFNMLGLLGVVSGMIVLAGANQ